MPKGSWSPRYVQKTIELIELDELAELDELKWTQKDTKVGGGEVGK